MSDSEKIDAETPVKSSKLPILIGLVLAAAGASGGFFAVNSGLILNTEHADHTDETQTAKKVPDIEFIAVDPLIVSLRAPSQAKHLRFRAQLEVPTAYAADVTKLLPRVVDVLNGYLRALDAADLEDPAALMRLRAQMLRRVQIVTGSQRISDLLIMEFVLN